MEQKINEIFSDVLNLETIDKNLKAEECEQWDSLAHLNLILALEEEFDVRFTPDEIRKAHSSLQIVMDLVRGKTNV